MTALRTAVFLLAAAFALSLGSPADAQNQRGKSNARGKTSASQKLYRWTDAQGNVHYTDSLPAEAIEQGRTEYTQGGREQSVIPRPPTAEERAQQAREVQRQAQALEEEKDREQERSALRTSYPSKDAIARDFDQRKTVFEGQVVAAEAMMLERRRSLLEQLKLAAMAELMGKEVSADMKQKIQEMAQQVQQQGETVAQARANISALGDEQARLVKEWENDRNTPPLPEI